MWFALMVEELLPAPDVFASPEIVITLNEILFLEIFSRKCSEKLDFSCRIKEEKFIRIRTAVIKIERCW